MPTIDPKVEEILRDVARDPRSSLLRVERPRIPRELRETRPRISLGATGLRSAERELLRAHRAEVAWLLKEMCKERLANEERSKLFLSRYIDAEHEVEILPADELRRRASELPRADMPPIETPWEDLGIRDLLERATAGPAEGRPSISQLALASLRLEPEDSARICLGLDLTFQRHAWAAVQIFSPLLPESCNSTAKVCALGNLALAFQFIGRLRLALRANLSLLAIDELGPRPDTTLNTLALAVLLGSRDVAQRTLDMLRRMQDREKLVDASNAIVLRRRVGEWPTTSQGHALAVSLLDRDDLTEEVRSVLQAIA